jgi:hypothetical protein
MEIPTCLFCDKKLRKLAYLKDRKWGEGINRKYHKKCWSERHLYPSYQLKITNKNDDDCYSMLKEMLKKNN